MVKPSPRRPTSATTCCIPKTLMLNYGYDPQLSEGAVKTISLMTSTFVFRTAEDGQDFFDYVSGRREPPEGMGAGLVLSGSIHPTARSSRTDYLSTSAPRNCALSRPAWRRLRPRSSHSFAPATSFYTLNRLWRGRNSVCKDACGPLHRCGRLCRRASTKSQSGWRRNDAMREGRVAMIFIETPQIPPTPVDIAMVLSAAEMIGQAQGHTPIVACDNTLSDGVSAADRTRRGPFLVLADQIYRRSFRPDRGAVLGQKLS